MEFKTAAQSITDLVTETSAVESLQANEGNAAQNVNNQTNPDDSLPFEEIITSTIQNLPNHGDKVAKISLEVPNNNLDKSPISNDVSLISNWDDFVVKSPNPRVSNSLIKNNVDSNATLEAKTIDSEQTNPNSNLPSSKIPIVDPIPDYVQTSVEPI